MIPSKWGAFYDSKYVHGGHFMIPSMWGPYSRGCAGCHVVSVHIGHVTD